MSSQGLRGTIPEGIKRYAEGKKFVPLADLLPLDTPLTVGIDPCNFCNFRCTFCPTGHSDLVGGRRKGMMSLDLFKKIIDDLKAFPKRLKRLYLYHEGEPLINPDLPAMIVYAKERDVAESVQTTTNGALLDRFTAGKLVISGLDLIRISVEHVTDEGYRRLTSAPVTYERIRRNVATLFEVRNRLGSHLRIHPKIMDTGLTTEEMEKFKADFGPISDDLNIQQLTGMPHPEKFDFTLGTHPTEGSEGALLKPSRIVCPQPFYVMLVKWNGVTVGCSEDWTWEVLTGDVRRQSMREIWEGEELRRLRLAHLRGERNKLPCCSTCPPIAGMPMEGDLDDVREKLLEVYSTPN